MTTFESCLNVVIWVRGWFSLRAIMFLCTWKPGGRRSSNSCIRLQSIFCRPHNNHYFTVRFDYLLSTVNGRSYPHTVGLVPNYWKLWVVHCSETPLSERKEPSSPPSCHTCWGHEKLFFSAWFMWGQASFGFFYLSELLCVDTKLGSKCFQRNVFCWLLCQLLDNMCPSLFPKWPLYLPPLKALIHPLLSLAGQN